jgi:hypothetical protein
MADNIHPFPPRAPQPAAHETVMDGNGLELPVRPDDVRAAPPSGAAARVVLEEAAMCEAAVRAFFLTCRTAAALPPGRAAPGTPAFAAIAGAVHAANTAWLRLLLASATLAQAGGDVEATWQAAAVPAPAPEGGG